MVIKLIIIAIILLLIIVMILDSNRFVVTEYEIESDKIDKDYRILFLSDLHSKVYGKDNEPLLTAIDSLNADVCFMAGDMVTAHKKRDYDIGAAFVGKIKEKMPVYYSYGNHEERLRVYRDFFFDAYDEYIDMLSKNNVHMLDNEMDSFEKLNVYGLTLEDKYYIKFDKVNLEPGETERLLGKKKEGFSVLLAHNPAFMDEYLNFGADLILSGHYHGGIMRLPIFGGVISPAFKLFPKYSGGLYTKGNAHIVVNKGIGAHTIPIRLFNPAEIVLIKLKKR